MASILILGATGYVGGRLAPRLLERGHEVRCLAREPRKLTGRHWTASATIVGGDLADLASLQQACQGVDIVYYLVHAMSAGEESFA
ncbi:MAG: NAD(P)H-binding protein, partial [bacterium]